MSEITDPRSKVIWCREPGCEHPSGIHNARGCFGVHYLPKSKLDEVTLEHHQTRDCRCVLSRGEVEAKYGPAGAGAGAGASAGTAD